MFFNFNIYFLTTDKIFICFLTGVLAVLRRRTGVLNLLAIQQESVQFRGVLGSRLVHMVPLGRPDHSGDVANGPLIVVAGLRIFTRLQQVRLESVGPQHLRYDF